MVVKQIDICYFPKISNKNTLYYIPLVSISFSTVLSNVYNPPSKITCSFLAPTKNVSTIVRGT